MNIQQENLYKEFIEVYKTFMANVERKIQYSIKPNVSILYYSFIYGSSVIAELLKEPYHTIRKICVHFGHMVELDKTPESYKIPIRTNTLAIIIQFCDKLQNHFELTVQKQSDHIIICNIRPKVSDSDTNLCIIITDWTPDKCIDFDIDTLAINYADSLKVDIWYIQYVDSLKDNFQSCHFKCETSDIIEHCKAKQFLVLHGYRDPKLIHEKKDRCGLCNAAAFTMSNLDNQSNNQSNIQPDDLLEDRTDLSKYCISNPHYHDPLYDDCPCIRRDTQYGQRVLSRIKQMEKNGWKCINSPCNNPFCVLASDELYNRFNSLF
ncbi:MAG: hypothetical protein Satyrvirus50_3 [Satyrvirus sp.]|uniref:Uncharacterized protein n=1 Tax=Satyrvirus sp. TaxID=2487771 RepID=A0A3G5AF83_9VIRU|nr:MAG: hypothetical protein Satyrvirus50_3 [Satyrvirus sp.]